MDLQPIHQPEATTTASTSERTLEQHTSSISAETRALRSSARVKAAKQKEKGKEHESPGQPSSSTAQPDIVASRTPRSSTTLTKSKRTRDNIAGKGKAKEVSDESPPRASKRYVPFTPKTA